MIRICFSVSAGVLVDLRLDGIQKHKQTGVIRIVRVVHESIEQIRRGHMRAGRKIGGAPDVKRDCISTVLEDAVIEDQIDARN